MTTTAPYRVARVDGISDRAFHEDYVRRELPVLIRGGCAHWRARQRWSVAYLSSLAPTLPIAVKTYAPSGEIELSTWMLSDYATALASLDAASTQPSQPLPYCHDVPLFGMIPGLRDDCAFPTGLLPAWYRREWWRFAQFFIGPRHSLTPLHFDTLLTHNLFVQVVGRKCFTLLPPSQIGLCGRRGWRWFDVDPERPDYGAHPEYRHTTPVTAIVEPGDILYLPPGTLHHVRSLDASISFNIDFHTRRSVLHALEYVARGMPRPSAYYNLIVALGLWCGIPSRVLLRYYGPYLSYVS